jgi:hypothetical protein
LGFDAATFRAIDRRHRHGSSLRVSNCSPVVGASSASAELWAEAEKAASGNGDNGRQAFIATSGSAKHWRAGRVIPQAGRAGNESWLGHSASASPDI